MCPHFSQICVHLKQMNESLLGGLNELQVPSVLFQLVDFEKAAPHVPVRFLGCVAKRRLKCSHLCESCHHESLKLGSEGGHPPVSF